MDTTPSSALSNTSQASSTRARRPGLSFSRTVTRNSRSRWSRPCLCRTGPARWPPRISECPPPCRADRRGTPRGDPPLPVSSMILKMPQGANAVHSALPRDLAPDVVHLPVLRQRVRLELEHAVHELLEVHVAVQVRVVAVEQRAARRLGGLVAPDVRQHAVELLELEGPALVLVVRLENLRQRLSLLRHVREVGDDLEALANELLEVVRLVVGRNHRGVLRVTRHGDGRGERGGVRRWSAQPHMARPRIASAR